MRHSIAIAILALLPALVGHAGAPAQPTAPAQPPPPIISHVSPAIAQIDDRSEVTVQLQGSGIGLISNLEVTYDTDPATRIHVCKKGLPSCSIEIVSDSAINCTIKWAGQKPEDALPVGQALHFMVIGAKFGTSKPSDQTFTAQTAVRVKPVSIVQPEPTAPLQIHVDAPGAGSGAHVIVFDAALGKDKQVACSIPQVIGGEDLVCDIEPSDLDTVGTDLRVQVLRANESGDPSPGRVAAFHKSDGQWVRGEATIAPAAK